MTEILLKHGRVVDPASGHDGVTDLRIVDGAVAERGDDLSTTGEVVDCAGLWVLPGLVDLHAHLREPGFEDAEDIATGSAAAAAGGYTAVAAMANTNPVCDTAAVAELVARRGADVGLVHVRPVGAITVGLAGERLSEMGELHDSAARVDFFSDDGIPVADSLMMRRALQYAARWDAVICNHSEDPSLTVDAQMNEGRMSALLGLPGWPREAEEVMIARDLILADNLGARLHVPHVSTAGSVDLIRRAKAAGVRVTAEVTPHHLHFDDGVVASYDPVYKVNPPVRTATDVTTLRLALADGTIDAVATDHAPHPHEQKDQEWNHAPCGMLGLETAFAVVVTDLVDTGEVDLSTVVRRFTTGPATVRDMHGHGGALVDGEAANVTVIDPDARWVVEGRALQSRAHNTPFEGEELHSRPVHTILGGRFTMRDGEVQW